MISYASVLTICITAFLISLVWASTHTDRKGK